MLSDYGRGSVRIMNFYEQLLIVLADFTPYQDFEKVSEIKQEYFEISQFETDSSSFKAGGRKVRQAPRPGQLSRPGCPDQPFCPALITHWAISMEKGSMSLSCLEAVKALI